MKKNISINISGIIFHIEEDGYEELRSYLDSVSNYFSSFDDSDEIISDIESRIAEIFLSKLNEGKQVITGEDVKSLVATMGSVEDFQALEEDMPKEEKKNERKKQAYNGGKKLFRDNQRKLLGGVSAGLAHYFGIDPLWVRLIVFLLAIGTGGIIILAYIVLWAALPESDQLEDDKQLKKMFRNPENKVLGGVANGVASYFGVDIAVIRLLFVLSIFLGGTGIIAYIILWLILPEANTITEKVQMQGEPVTLSNIESSIKESLNVKEGEENVFVKILLFPFRLIAAVISGLSKALGPVLLFLVEAIRIIAGVIFTLTGLGFIFFSIIALGVLLGIFTGHSIIHGDFPFPIDLFGGSFPIGASIAGFFFTAIPAAALIILGVSIIAKSRLITSTVGWSMFAMWIVSIIFLSFTVPSIIYNFHESGSYTVSESYNLDNKTVVLKLQEAGLENYDEVRLQLKGYKGPEFKLVMEYEANGKSRRDAIENAKMIEYNVDVNDSIFTFDSNISFKKDAIFRAQHMHLVLYIPYNRPFVMDDDLRYILRSTMYRYGYQSSQIANNTWIFTPAGLECMTCEKEYYNYDSHNRKSRNEYSRKFDFTDFSELVIGSAFKANIVQGDEYRVVINGTEKDVDNVIVSQDGDELVFGYEDDRFDPNGRKRKRVEIQISMPHLEALNLSGKSESYIRGFNEEKVELSISGKSYAEANIDATNVEASIKGASTLELKGEGLELEAVVKGNSQLNATLFKVNNADINLSGSSEAELYVTDNLDVDASFVDKIKNRGGAKLTKKDRRLIQVEIN